MTRAATSLIFPSAVFTCSVATLDEDEDDDTEAPSAEAVGSPTLAAEGEASEEVAEPPVASPDPSALSLAPSLASVRARLRKLLPVSPTEIQFHHFPKPMRNFCEIFR